MKRFIVMMLVLALMASLFATAFAAKKITIAGIVFQEDQFMKTILTGMSDAAKKYKVELFTGNTSNNISKEIELINTYTARKVDAICITSLSKTVSVPALKAANDKGIKIVTYNTPIDADFPVSYINSSQEQLGSSTGKIARKYIETKLKGKKVIKVATLGARSQVPEISDARVNSFLNEIKDIPGVTIVAQQDAWLTDMAIQKVGDILTANPDLDIVFGLNDGATKGAVLAVKNAGKAGKTAVFGIDADAQVADFLLADDDILQAVTGQQPYKIGYMSVEFAVKALKKQKIEKTVIVPGLTLDRNVPDAIKKFKASL